MGLRVAPLLFLFVCTVAGWIVGGLEPARPLPDEPQLRTEPFRLLRPSDQPLEVTPAKWLQVPWLYADFDLHMDVELGEHTRLDVLLRQVEPRHVQRRIEPFHGRFTVLRLTTDAGGAPFLRIPEALVGTQPTGVELAAGHRATVWVQARGRLLRANVAGRWLPWFEAEDDYGIGTLVARGGPVVLRHLVIEPLGGRAWYRSRWAWAALGVLAGLVLLAVAFANGAAGRRLALAGAVLVGGVAWSVARAEPPPLWSPPSGPMLAVLAAWVLLAALVVGWPRRWLPGAAIPEVLPIVVAAAALAAAGLLHNGALRGLSPSPSLRAQTAALDELFGPAAGSTVAEALAQRVRGRLEIHSPGAGARCVFLLGGQLLYDRALAGGAPGPGADPADDLAAHLVPLLLGELRAALGERIDVPCLPTVDGWSGQQWRMFEAFYEGFRPAVVVLGIGPDEAAVDPHTGLPRSDARALAATIARARERAPQLGSRLVVFVAREVPDELMAVVRRETAVADIPLVVAAGDEPPPTIASRLAAALLPLLRR